MERVDILIVGSGASGAAAAWSLSRDSSLKILCLEQGSITDPAKYPSTSPQWELTKQSKSSFDPNVRANEADFPIDASNSPISLANYNGFGGSTILYSGHFPRFHPSDFAVKSLDGVADDWPLSYQDLEPFFTQNEKMMGVAGLVGDTAYPDYESLLPPVSLGAGGRKMAEAFNKLNWHWWPSYSAINTRHHQGRPPCINLGPCNTGCAQGAKGSVDMTYWPEAKKQGVEVRTECTVFDIVLDYKGRAKGVRYLDKEGAEHLQEAAVVILAGSGIGTPRLLLNSKSPAYPNGLLNDNGLVGRNLMLHPLAYVEGVFESNIQSSIGPHGCCLLSQVFYESQVGKDIECDFIRGYTMQILRGTPPLDTALSGYLTRRLPLGSKHHQAFAKTFNHNMGIAIISEDLPEWHNHIELDSEHCDRHGIPGIKVHYKMNDNTKNMLKHGIARSKELFSVAGAKVVSAFSPVKHAGWHLMGTARMGLDPKTSVVNQHGQAHSIDNLFIVDSSVFVTSGAVNPVATAQALTLKICDELRKNIKELVKS